MAKKVERRPARPIYPTPAGLVASVDSEGKANIMSVAEIFNLSIGDPVWIGISIREATYTHGLIKQQGEFTVNLPTAAMLKKVLGCGSCSGRDGIDKFEKYDLTPLPSKHVGPPIIAECPMNLECKVVGFHPAGDHDLFIGEVLLEHIDEDALDAEGQPDNVKLDPLLLMRGGFWRLGEKI